MCEQNKIRMKMMEKAGYSKREDPDAGDEWIVIDEDGSDGAMSTTTDELGG